MLFLPFFTFYFQKNVNGKFNKILVKRWYMTMTVEEVWAFLKYMLKNISFALKIKNKI